MWLGRTETIPTAAVRHSTRSGETTLDSLCLAVIVALLAAPFISKLGFYSDDWSLIAGFVSDLEHGRFGLETALRGFEPRPLQGAYLSLLFYAFRLDPLGYHLVNTAVLAASVVLFYQLLLRVDLERRIAFAAAAIVIVLPQLSTARVWFSTFQIPLAMLLAMASLHALVSYAEVGRLRWAAAAILAAIASTAAYEIFAPIILAFGLWLALESRGGAKLRMTRQHTLVAAAAILVAVAIVVVAKGAVTGRVQQASAEMYLKGLIRLVQPDYDWRIDGSLNVFAAIEVELWQPVAGLWRAIAPALSGGIGLAPTAAGAAAALLTGWRLAASAGNSDGLSGGLRAMLIGIAVFVLGHATFLINSQMMFAPTGIGNRVLVAAALGLGLAAAGLAALAASKLPARLERLAFTAAVSLIVLFASWRVEQIYSYWAQGWSMQREIIASVRRDLRQLPAGSTVIVDGVCPYHGPAVVLESWWDSSGMLTVVLERPVVADTSTNRMAMTPRGLETTIYRDRRLYPFGERLYVYDPSRHFLKRLLDRAAAEHYFRSPGRNFDCRAGYVGQGQLM